ncbi:MAG: rhomboid family intramembrane serine protease [Bacteroidales bacterium]|nr:rhomboid family intramembrane serine protease [Bacteroidales bacterium]
MSSNITIDEKRKFRFACVIPCILLLSFWLITIAQTTLNLDLHQLGIYPQKIEGLLGIISAPFEHSDFKHLLANTVPFFVLSVSLFYFYREISFPVFITIWLCSGLYTWVAGRPSWHIGVSGVIYGLFAFIMLSGLIRKSKELIAISLIVIFLYGGMVWGFWADLYPPNTSFEAHTGGLITGVLLAVVFRKKGPQRKKYSLEMEDENALFPFVIAIDETIPYIKFAFDGLTTVKYIKTEEMNVEHLYDSDAMIIRSVTRCNRALLQQIPVKCIATTSIGFDHIDTQYCEETGIRWINAPGCNSGSVMQYIASALAQYAIEKNFSLEGKTIGIIGVGHVGKKVAMLASILKMNVLLYDPPREEKEGKTIFCTLESLQQKADIITFHVPLEKAGKYPTFHLLDDNFLQQLKKKPLIINACRGKVWDYEAVERGLQAGIISDFIADVWDNEPKPRMQWIQKAFLATPHIAGYSRDGKANATTAAVRAVANYFQLPLEQWSVDFLEAPEQPAITWQKNLSTDENLLHCLLSTYPILKDDQRFRNDISQFESLRLHYPVRREYAAFTVEIPAAQTDLIQRLQLLDFHIKIMD